MADGADGKDAGTTLKFGFAKTQQKKNVAVNIKEASEKRQVITGFEGDKAKGANGDDDSNSVHQKVIARLENTYKTGVGKKFVPSFIPEAHDDKNIGNTEDRFEAAKEDTRPNVTGYGLEVRKQRGQDEDADRHHDQRSGPLVSKSQLEAQKYKEELEALPEAPEEEAYENMPIEDFGKAMLFGMGWKEGTGVGRNRKVAEPIEYLQRPERLGLGANPAALAATEKKKIVKMGDKPEVDRKNMVLAPSADGRIRHVRKLDEKLVHRSEVQAGPRPGKKMLVVGGRHEGLQCVVVAMLEHEPGRSNRCTVRLVPSDEVVEIREKDLEDITASRNGHQSRSSDRNGRDGHASDRSDRHQGNRSDREATPRDGDDSHKDTQRHKESGSKDRDRERDDYDDDKYRHGKESKDGKRRRDDEYDNDRKDHHDSKKLHRDDREGIKKHSKHRHHSSDDDEDMPAQKGPTWLAPFIKVRVVDKKARRGKLYLKKGTVVDVHPGGKCDLVMDETRETVQLSQAQLETVVPKDMNAALLIVSGEFKGSKARLQAKSDKGACAVQLVSDFTIQRLLLDEVAMYVGPMDDE